MGWFSPDVETNEENLVDSSGHVNNNIIIQEAKDTHLQTAISEQLLIATYAMIAIEILKLAICSYNVWRKRIKRKYNGDNTTKTFVRTV